MLKKALTILGLCILTQTTFAQNNKMEASVLCYNLSDPFIDSISFDLKDKAKKENIDLKIYNAQYDLLKQVEQLQSAIVGGSKVLLVNPIDTLNGSAVLKCAEDASLPIIFFNRIPSQNLLQSYDKAWYIGSNGEESGQLQAEILDDYINTNGSIDKNKNGKIDYVLIKGEKGHQDTESRSNAFIKNMIHKGYKLNPLADFYANWTFTSAVNEFSNKLLSTNIDDIEAIICNNDAMALGVISVLNAYGYNLGNGKNIPVIGVDALDEARTMIKSGKMTGTVSQNSNLFADTLIKATKAIYTTGNITPKDINIDIKDRIIYIPATKITAKELK